jgi:hypothetical protein
MFVAGSLFSALRMTLAKWPARNPWCGRREEV